MHSVMTANGENIFFDADDGVNGRHLWVSDGTAIGTHVVTSNGAYCTRFSLNQDGLLGSRCAAQQCLRRVDVE